MTNLKSDTISKVLIIMLWILAVLSVIITITTFFYAYNFEYYYDVLYPMESFAESLDLVLYLITVVIYLVWIFKVHQDINDLVYSYDITPKGALARILIPIYNIWGIGNTYNTLGRHFQEHAALMHLGKLITRSVPFLYIYLSGVNAVERYLKIKEYNVSDNLILFISIFDIFGMILFLVIVKSVYNGLTRLAAEKRRAMEELQINDENQPSNIGDSTMQL